MVKHNNRGFTFIEISIALLILGVGLISILALFPIGFEAAARAFTLTRATFLAQGLMEELKESTGLSEEKVKDEAVNRNLQKRILEPEEIAALAVYLASDDARGITGQAINICGGMVFH